LQLQKGSTSYTLDDQLLAGGKIKGLLAFEQNDLSLAKNLCGRLAMTVGLSVNKQHMAGWDFDGNAGTEMFSVPTLVAGLSTDGAQGNVTFDQPTNFTKFVASNYVVQMNSAGTGGNVIRQIDGQSTAFTDATDLANQPIDGLKFNFTLPVSGPGPGKSMLFKPFRLDVFRSDDGLHFNLTDDGAGLSRQALLARALRQGLPIPDNTADDAEIWPFIFEPGFSTASQVTDISGRGVGLDVVRQTILDLGGRVQVQSKAGEGLTFAITVPDPTGW
jgi:flagellar hook-associated protein FlgK